MYVTAWRFLTQFLNDEELNAFFVQQTQRTLRKVFFEPASSTPEVSISFGNGGRIDFADAEKLCQFTLSFTLPLYSDSSAEVTMEFLDLFYRRVKENIPVFYNAERAEERVPRLILYGMSPAVTNIHSETDFCQVTVLLAFSMFEDLT